MVENKYHDDLAYYIDVGRRYLSEHGYLNNADELKHHGIKGMKWGVRRFQNKDGLLTSAGRKKYNNGTELSQVTPKMKDSNGDYIYAKGTIVGRYGKQKLDSRPMYLYTNEKDRQTYKNHIGGEEQKFVIKKSIKIPDENRQLFELYRYTNDRNVINDPYNYWKDNINQGGKIADGYFKYMTEKGYDALVDVRNSGMVSDDPILLLNPVEYLKEVK